MTKRHYKGGEGEGIIMSLILMLLVGAGIFGAWYMGLIGGTDSSSSSSSSSSSDSSSDSSSSSSSSSGSSITTCGGWYDATQVTTPDSFACPTTHYINREKTCPSGGCNQVQCCSDTATLNAEYCSSYTGCGDDERIKDGPDIQCLESGCTKLRCCMPKITCATFEGDCSVSGLTAKPATTLCDTVPCSYSDCCASSPRYDPEGVGLPNRDPSGNPISYSLRSVGKYTMDGGGGWCEKTSWSDAIECEGDHYTDGETFKIYAAAGGQDGWVITTSDDFDDDHCQLDDDGLLDCDFEYGEATHFSLTPIGQHTLGDVVVPGSPTNGKTGYFAITAGGQPAFGDGPGYSCGMNDDFQIECNRAKARYDFANLSPGTQVVDDITFEIVYGDGD